MMSTISDRQLSTARRSTQLLFDKNADTGSANMYCWQQLRNDKIRRSLRGATILAGNARQSIIWQQCYKLTTIDRAAGHLGIYTSLPKNQTLRFVGIISQ